MSLNILRSINLDDTGKVLSIVLGIREKRDKKKKLIVVSKLSSES